MSRADQQRWDARYAEGAYAQRTHPSAFLQRRFPALQLPAGASVLDVACGAGRNALYLAALGCTVWGVDGSSVAIERGRTLAPNLSVQWLVADLESGLPPQLPGCFDLILMIRYVNLSLLRQLCDRLNPGGYLLVEQHLQTSAAVGGPERSAFRVAPGALRATTGSLQVLVAEEGLLTDPDGQPMALSRLLARRLPPPASS